MNPGRSWFLIFLFSLMAVVSQARDNQAYVDTYHLIAIREMREFGIPASITLAQGILESAAGTSYLATKANNHFGIKCHSDWKGGKVYRDDDQRNECFRKYDHVEESYRDHSLFLKNRGRYAFLFDLQPTDYKGWARGLSKAGYATNPKYPQLLIDLIERYELYKFDDPDFYLPPGADQVLSAHVIMRHPNRLPFIIARKGDTFESISDETEVDVADLLRYNDLTYESELKEGQLIFLKKKRKKGHEKYYSVESGETMYSISQKFGIRMEYLYKKNLMKVGEQPDPGQKMWLRRTKGKKFLGLF